MQSGFPLGVSQTVNNTNLLGAGQRPNIGAGRRHPGARAASPIGCATIRTTISISTRRRSRRRAAGTFGNAPRMLDGVYSPWRNSTDLAINKDLPIRGDHRATLRMEVINLFDNPWYAALASTAQGNANFGRVSAQATTRARSSSRRGTRSSKGGRTGGWRPSRRSSQSIRASAGG